jgi:hypothetical protein
MEPESSIGKRKRPLKKVLLWTLAILFILFSIVTIYVTRNFNQILADALMKSFNSSIVSDVYELKFEKLRVNIFAGNIRVFNVVMQPRETPLHPYPYINSSFRLETGKVIMENVEIMDLIKLGVLRLSRIEINKPDIQVWLNGEKNIFLPYMDTTNADKAKPGKRFINSFSLEEFQLADASFHIINTAKKNEFTVKDLSILLSRLLLDQQSGQDMFSFDAVELAISEVSGRMQEGSVRNFKVQHIKLDINVLDVRKSIDTLIFNFKDFNAGLKNLDFNTSDSIFNLSLKQLDLSYANRSVSLTGIAYKPNLSQAEMLKREKFQKAQFSVAIGSLHLLNLNFDTLLHRQKVYVDDIKIDSVEVSLFKDKSKPIDKTKFPEYLGQKIASIPIPILVKRVKATRAGFVNVERKEDGKYAKVIIRRGALEVKNITNLPSTDLLSVAISGYLENKVSISLNAAFSYLKPQFSINGRVGKSDLSDLNQLLAAYSPAAIKKGFIDQITFSGTVYRTKATGTMKFLYHDLDVDLKLTEKDWQNSVVGFAANTYLNASNPPSPEKPPRVVTYHAERDMNKGGFNIVLKSVLNGLKETMIMSKENKKTYKEDKKKWRKGK